VIAVVVAPDYWTEALILARGLPDVPDMREPARSAAQSQVDKAVAADPALGSVDVAVDAIAAVGPTGKALVDAAGDAELLVLGHRGRGAIGSAVLGSVGLYCVMHATGPVTIVPAGWSAAPVAGTASAS
jgi:nucleotide-binding universal stress UspA family protein